MAAWDPRGMGQSHVDYSRDTGKVGSAAERPRTPSLVQLLSWTLSGSEKYADGLHGIVELGASVFEDWLETPLFLLREYLPGVET